MYDLKIINAIIIDGTGSSRFFGEIAVNGNIIVERGQKLGASKNVYDAEWSYSLSRNNRYTYTL